MIDKSINASERLETHEKSYYYGLFSAVCDLDFDHTYFDLDFWGKKCLGFGINPTHSTEKGCDGS